MARWPSAAEPVCRPLPSLKKIKSGLLLGFQLGKTVDSGTNAPDEAKVAL